MKTDDEKSEIRFIGKKETKKLEQQAINKIGEEEFAVGFITGKIILLLFYEIITAVALLIGSFVAFAEKDILSITFNSLLVLIFIHSVIENIILINKLQKTQIKEKE